MIPSNHGIGTRPFPVRVMLACGVIGPLFFIIVFLIQGALRGSGYSPLRHMVSALSIGGAGWIQSVNFFISGALILASAVGLRLSMHSSKRSIWGPFLIGLTGIGLIGAGIFTTDPMNGYPPGTPLVPTGRTTNGSLHDLFGVPVFLGLPVACFVFTRLFARLGERNWAAYSLLSGIGMLVAFVLTSVGLNQVAGLQNFAGLFQRLTIAIGFFWIALLAAHWLKASG